MSTSRDLPRTPLALTVLSLLNEASMHPYEMKILMRERGTDRFVRVRGGSLYDTVERLRKLGFVEPLQTHREGRRPERTVYAITEAGRDELKEWLRELLSQPLPDYPQFEAALAFMASLDPEEWRPLLVRRAAALEASIGAREIALRATSGDDAGIPRIFLIEEEYALAIARAELEWVRQTIAELKEGTLAMPSAEVLHALRKVQQARREVSE